MIILLKFWKEGILAILLSLSLYMGYSKIKDIGYTEAENKYLIIIQEHHDSVASKVAAIEDNSNILILSNEKANANLATDINTILSKVKGKTLTIIKDGECLPNQTFSDSFTQVNKRVNQSIKESQK